MRYGYCLNMVATKPDKTGVEHMRTIRDIGYDYAELPCAEIAALDENSFDRLCDTAKASKLPCEAANNFFPATVKLTGSGVNDEVIDSYAGRALNRLERLGIGTVVFGSGPAKNVDGGFPMEKAYYQIVRLLKRIAPAAMNRGIQIVIEPLRTAECNIINSFAQGVRLMEDVGMENVFALVDYYHLREMNEPASNIVKLGKGRLRHAHFARQEGRTCPRDIGEDRYYKPFFQALRLIGYNERISCESYSDNFIKDAERTLQFFKEADKNYF